MRYKDKIVLITGSGSGIGKAAAIAFAKEGGTLLLNLGIKQCQLIPQVSFIV
jgi:NAD(P)-dependent dehydrogenase (short-subunit alcohol dehydrogenase family)